MHAIHMLICFIYSKTFESGLLMSSISTVQEDTGGCVNKYRYDLAIPLMTVLTYLYDIIMDLGINKPGPGNNVVDEINAVEKRYLNKQMELSEK